MTEAMNAHPVATVIACTLFTLAGTAVLISAMWFGRSIKVAVLGVHAELVPNGGSSLRDAVDRVEAAAGVALSEAQAAAVSAATASEKAQDCLERIERMERPQQISVDIHPVE